MLAAVSTRWIEIHIVCYPGGGGGGGGGGIGRGRDQKDEEDEGMNIAELMDHTEKEDGSRSSLSSSSRG